MRKTILVLLVTALIALPSVYAQDTAGTLYVKPEKENLRATPNGSKIGEIDRGAKLKVLDKKGDWVKVSVEGWIWKNSTTSNLEQIKKVSKGASGKKLELVDFDVKGLPVNTDVSRYSAEAVLTLYVKNNTSKRIKAWKALVVIKNGFGDILFRTRLTDGTANIAPGATEKASFSWEDNQFISDEPYDKIMAYSKENLKIELKEIKLIQ